MILLYAVTCAPAAEVDGLESFAGDQVSVLYEPRDEPPEQTFGEVLRFGRRIQLLARGGPLLPIRFGTLVDDHEQLRGLVSENESAWARQLGHVAGHCELIVHLEIPGQRSGEEHRPYASGADYLRRRAAAAQARRDVVEGLLDNVRRRVKDHRPLPRTEEERLALLVPEQDAAAVRESVEQWARSSDELGVKISGPWPPFSFCEEVGS